jgi:hypothetical protein
MSNLGKYQTITTMAKKLGGVDPLIAIVALGGALVSYPVLRSIEEIIKSGVNKHKASQQKKDATTSIMYTVSKVGKSNEGLQFNIGDTFRVLEQDGNAVLIEKIGDANNPYFVAFDFLKSISNYN